MTRAILQLFILTAGTIFSCDAKKDDPKPRQANSGQITTPANKQPTTGTVTPIGDATTLPGGSTLPADGNLDGEFNEVLKQLRAVDSPSEDTVSKIVTAAAVRNFYSRKTIPEATNVIELGRCLFVARKAPAAAPAQAAAAGLESLENGRYLTSDPQESANSCTKAAMTLNDPNYIVSFFSYHY